MRLSEAIREGCKMTIGQAKGHFLIEKGNALLACALGAAALAMHVEANQLTLRKVFPELSTPTTYNDPYRILFDEIVSLNDHGGWSRERIADWIEGLGY